MSNQDAITVSEAARLLGTTNERIARLVKRGVLTSRVSNLDRRRRLISRQEVERILQEEGWKPPARRRPSETPLASRRRPRSVAIYAGPLNVTSDEIDEYLARNWKP